MYMGQIACPFPCGCCYQKKADDGRDGSDEGWGSRVPTLSPPPSVSIRVIRAPLKYCQRKIMAALTERGLSVPAMLPPTPSLFISNRRPAFWPVPFITCQNRLEVRRAWVRIPILSLPFKTLTFILGIFLSLEETTLVNKKDARVNR